jgi:hypothetical protein
MKQKSTVNGIQEIVEEHLYTAMLAAFDFQRPEDGSQVGSILQMYVDKFMETQIKLHKASIKYEMETLIENVDIENQSIAEQLTKQLEKYKKEINYLKLRIMILENKDKK